MNNSEMNCASHDAALSAMVDGDLQEDRYEALSAHVAECGRCRDVLEGYRQVATRAQGLEDRPPVGDLWAGIAERIGASPPARPRRFPRTPAWVPQLLAASVVVVLGVSGARLFWPAGTPALDAGADPVVVPVAAGVDVSTGYEGAINDLVEMFDASRETMDPNTVRVIEKNLAVIDDALARARVALAADPESDFLRRHMERTSRQKLEILQRVTALTAD